MSASNARYADSKGETYSQKPEHMTQLRGNLLVSKTHPRIALRGKLDSLIASVIQAQVAAFESDLGGLVEDLQEIRHYIGAVIASEVLDRPMDVIRLLGMDQEQLRRASHNPKQYVGVEHMAPEYTMGKAFAAVNATRTMAREAELAALHIFVDRYGRETRPDIGKAMNRLSSALYVVMCRLLANHYRNR